MLKKAYLLIVIIFGYAACFGQTTFLPLGSEDQNLLDRLETRSGRLCDSIALGVKAESRRNAVNFLENIKSKYKINADNQTIKQGEEGTTQKSDGLSKIDEYNL